MTPQPVPLIDDFFISDGFVYNAAIRPALEYDYRAIALKRMRALRLSTYKPYTYCTRTYTLAPFSNIQHQIRMLPGTYLWGYWLAIRQTDGSACSPHNIYVKLIDAATGFGPFGDWIADQDLNIFPPTNAVGAGYIAYPQLFIEPYVMADPAMLTVEFSNNGHDNQTDLVQMQFFGCVPCVRPQGTVDCEYV